MYRIAIHSVPRSGSSWLGELFNSSYSTKYCFQPLFSYALKNFLSIDSTGGRIDEFFARLETTQDEFICQLEKRKEGVLPLFEKRGLVSHIVYKEVRYANILKNMMERDAKVRLICIIRNPLAVISSWFSAPKEFDPEWDRAAEWFLGQSKNKGRDEEFYGFKRWIDAARIFHYLKDHYPDRVMILRYSDLLMDRVGTIDRLLGFAHLERDEQMNRFISESNERDVSDTYSVFRSRPSDDRWKSVLSQDIIDGIRNCLKDDPLAIYLSE